MRDGLPFRVGRFALGGLMDRRSGPLYNAPLPEADGVRAAATGSSPQVFRRSHS